MTYAGMCRAAAQELESLRYRDGLGRELPGAVATFHATHLRTLADLLDQLTPEIADKLEDATVEIEVAPIITASGCPGFETRIDGCEEEAAIVRALTSPLPG